MFCTKISLKTLQLSFGKIHKSKIIEGAAAVKLFPIDPKPFWG